MEQLLNFAKDMAIRSQMTRNQIAKSHIEDWLKDLEETYPEQVKLIQDILDTMEN